MAMIEELKLKLAERRRAVEGAVASSHATDVVTEGETNITPTFKSLALEFPKPSCAVAGGFHCKSILSPRKDNPEICEQTFDFTREKKCPVAMASIIDCGGYGDTSSKSEQRQQHFNKVLSERDGVIAQNQRLHAELRHARVENTALNKEIATLRMTLQQQQGYQLGRCCDAQQPHNPIELPKVAGLCPVATASGQPAKGFVGNEMGKSTLTPAAPPANLPCQRGLGCQEHHADILENFAANQGFVPDLVKMSSPNSCTGVLPCVHRRADDNDLVDCASLWDTIQQLRKEMSDGKERHTMCDCHMKSSHQGMCMGLTRIQCSHLELKMLARRLQIESQ